MRYKRAVIDSLNLSDNHIEAIFIHHEDFNIEPVKSRGTFKPTVWSKTFGRALTRNIVEAKIIHTYKGATLPLKTFAITPISQTLEFAGLHGYNKRSKLILQTLRELKSQLDTTRITRIDIAIDYQGEIPRRVVTSISKTRKPFKYGNTTYYKTEKEKKTNQKMDIKIYNKAHQAKLDYPLQRLEFVFKGNYFNKLLYKDLDLAINKMEKSIKKATGMSVKIEAI